MWAEPIQNETCESTYNTTNCISESLNNQLSSGLPRIVSFDTSVRQIREKQLKIEVNVAFYDVATYFFYSDEHQPSFAVRYLQTTNQPYNDNKALHAKYTCSQDPTTTTNGEKRRRLRRVCGETTNECHALRQDA